MKNDVIEQFLKNVDTDGFYCFKTHCIKQEERIYFQLRKLYFELSSVILLAVGEV